MSERLEADLYGSQGWLPLLALLGTLKRTVVLMLAGLRWAGML